MKYPSFHESTLMHVGYKTATNLNSECFLTVVGPIYYNVYTNNAYLKLMLGNWGKCI